MDYISNEDGSIRLSVSIMAVPSRRDLVNALIERLTGECAHLTVATSWGSKFETIWNTACSSYKQYSLDATHHLVLQDDAVLCNHFLEGLLLVLTARPDSIIIPFCFDPLAEFILEEGGHWLPNCEVGGVAVCFPITLLSHFLTWEQKVFKHSYPADDLRVMVYALFFKRYLINCVPSLVDHGYVPSMIGHHRVSETLTSSCFIGEQDPRSINWSDTTILARGNKAIYGMTPYHGTPLHTWMLDAIKPEYRRCFYCHERLTCEKI